MVINFPLLILKKRDFFCEAVKKIFNFYTIFSIFFFLCKFVSKCLSIQSLVQYSVFPSENTVIIYLYISYLFTCYIVIVITQKFVWIILIQYILLWSFISFFYQNIYIKNYTITNLQKLKLIIIIIITINRNATKSQQLERHRWNSWKVQHKQQLWGETSTKLFATTA